MPTVPLKLGCWMKSVIVTWSPMWRARPCLSVSGSDADSVGGGAVVEDEAADWTGGREERARGDRLRGLSLTEAAGCAVAEEEDAVPGRPGGGGRSPGCG